MHNHHRKLQTAAALLALSLLCSCRTASVISDTVPLASAEAAPIENFHVVVPGDSQGRGAIYRSAQPQKTDWEYLQRLGVRTVVRLNEFNAVTPDEEAEMARRYNIRLISHYMQPEDLPHNLWPWAHPDERLLLQTVSELENPENLPALVHCSHGRDRTGLVVATFSVRNKRYCKSAAIEEMNYYGANPLLLGLRPMLDSASIVEAENCIQRPGSSAGQ